ncbi:glycosyltransferase family 4 protein [Brockia lithotrophica]|uniref:Glycosyltransferase involved in cell wall biosynthesis n=1 Tax=Brockia lithotrophica TaxID=933949 RepID=A0A660L6J3_9BACL|nr:glycosyltransferase family 4 protein [Brockia lithotrophica]RKQ88844.1 glycosyltransferase involved in cell wall biosynthesis [Brockia lithotrophica]
MEYKNNGHIRVFLVGHAISPNRGSEPGNTWNWAWELSKYTNVDVFAYPQHRKEIEKFILEHPRNNLRFHWVTLDNFDPWHPEKGESGLRFHYILWLRKVYKIIKNLIDNMQEPIVVHQVSWSTVSTPPPILQGVPIVWGPVSGGQVAPASFRDFFGNAWPKEMVRSWRVSFYPLILGWGRRVSSLPLILAVNRETEALLRKAGAKRVEFFLDCGVPSGFGLPKPQEVARPPGPLRLLWAGRLDFIKALPLVLMALRRVRVPVELLVAGDGPLKLQWQSAVQRLGLSDKVRFLGRIPWDKMKEVFQEAHAFVFTSLRDGFGCVVLEAMSFGLPVITLDHQGVGTFLPADAAIKVPVRTPEETFQAISEGIERLALDEDLRLRMSREAWRFAQEERWDRRAERMLALYEEVLSHAHRRV